MIVLKKILILLLFFFSTQGFTASNSKTKVSVAINPTPNGDWLNESIYPITLKEKMRARYNHETGWVMADFDNDGIDDIFFQGSANLKDLITIDEDTGANSDITVNVACDIRTGETSHCYSPEKHRTTNLFLIKDNVTYEKWNGKKQRMESVTGFQMIDASYLIADNNPVEMKSQMSMQVLVKDFNGDGVIDMFVNDAGVELYDGVGPRHLGKNDLYYLSQPDGTWLESTVTHVTGKGVKKGRGLRSFSHGITAGDIDNDGDIDVVVTSIDWVGTNASLFCYVNQGDGHMKVRRCGDQFGWEVELGDIDNDGNLDIVLGGMSLASKKEWANVDGMGDCHGLSSCPRSYNGILLNDGKGKFFKRGFAFPDYKDSNGFTYAMAPFISVADLDVIRLLLGRLYQGGTMSIEENIGNGQFRTAYQDEWCKGPKTKAE